MDFDDLLDNVGSFGRYQIILLLLLCIPAGIPVAFYALNLVFIQATPDHWCYIAELDDLNMTAVERKNISIPATKTSDGYKYSQCVQYVPLLAGGNNLTTDKHKAYFDYNHTQECTTWEYDTNIYKRTTVSDWDLVCASDWLPPFVFALFNTGSVIGNMLFGYFQDKIGRKPSFFICLTIQLVCGVAASFSVNVAMLSTLRLFIGLTVPAILNAPLVLVIELVGPSKHTAVTLVICLCYSLSITLIPLLAYLINDWTYLSLATSLPFLLFYGLYWFMPESPRWLIAVNKLDKAEQILSEMARKNGTDLPQSKLQQMLSFVKTAAKDASGAESGGRLQELFSHPNLRKKTVCVTMLWLSNVMVYTGLSYYMPLISGDPYINFLLAGVAELPAYPILYLVLDRWGRRWLISAAMVISGLACISTVFIPEDLLVLLLSLVFIGKVCISISFIINYIYTAEIYPTVVRGVGLGFSTFVAGIGNIGLPFIVYLGKDWLTLPVIIMGAIAVVGGVAGSFLPETLHQHLPQSIQDGERFGADSKYFQCLPSASSSSSPPPPAAASLLIERQNASAAAGDDILDSSERTNETMLSRTAARDGVDSLTDDKGNNT